MGAGNTRDQWQKYSLLVIGLLFFPWSGYASQLALPAATPEEASLAGNVVALPLNPVAALFHNPAQLTLLPNSVTVSTLGIRFLPQYASPSGYQSTSREFPVSPSVGYVTDRWAPFHVGIGMYGALGFSYNHDADPEHGVPEKFYTDLAILSLAPAVAYSLRPNLHIGVGINPSYGRLRFKTPSPVGKIDTDVRGPGVFGTLGLLYQPTPDLNVGISYRTPGTVFMFGNARVAGQGDDARVEFQLPQHVEFGLAYHFLPSLIVTVQARWTQFSVYEDTQLEFDQRQFLNRPAANDARDRFRLGGGLQYKVFRWMTVQVGFSWERWALEDSSLSPTLPDLTEYYMFPTGVTIERGAWKVHLLAGWSYIESRHVSADRNPFFPGRYSLDQSIFGLQVIRLLGTARIANAQEL
jgi:long-subunit fatty acid transport protein